MRGIFIDTETTGIDANKHVALEICVRVVDMSNIDAHDNTAQYHSCITCSAYDWIIADHSALSLNGFDDRILSMGKPAEKVRIELLSFILSFDLTNSNSFFICQNPTFDKPFFDKIITLKDQLEYDIPYHWLDLASMYWMVMYARSSTEGEKISLSKDSIAQKLNLPIEEKPHKAIYGVQHLIECYKALIKYKNSNG